MSNKSIRIVLLIITLFLPSVIFCQQPDPKEIIEKVNTEYAKIKDYQVDVSIKIDVEFMDVPDGSAKIYFKQPDKVSIKSKDFALMPREGLNFNPGKILMGNYTPVYIKEDIVDGKPAHQIKIVPLDENSDFILSTVWIDKAKPIIIKVEATSKKQGTYSLFISYGSTFQYALPTKLTFMFDIKRDNLPKDFSGQMKKKSLADSVKGKVYVYYSNYQVNKGIPESVFSNKNK
jgi:outer membrane lipoprotein-sorting protein